jgi:hypothetical protein
VKIAFFIMGACIMEVISQLVVGINGSALGGVDDI